MTLMDLIDEDSFYFFTAKGKNVTKELLADGRVQILVYTKFKEMIRLLILLQMKDRRSALIRFSRNSHILQTSILITSDISVYALR